MRNFKLPFKPGSFFFTMRLLFFVLALIPIIVFCQDNDKKEFTLKPAMGINACQIHGDTYSGFNKMGLFFGASVNARLSEKSSLELGFYFSQKGSRHNQNPKANDYSYYRLHLNYIDLPLSFRYQLNSNYFITMGPSFAYLVSYNEQSTGTSLNGKYNKTEVGLNIGLGRALKNGFHIEVRNSNSVTPIRTITGNLVYYTNPIARYFNKGFYSNMLTVFISYTINQNKKRAE